MAPSQPRPRRLLAAAVLAAAAVGIASASPAPSAGTKVAGLSMTQHQRMGSAAGRIVFARHLRDGPIFIATSAPDGSDLRRLTGRGQSYEPRWSPSGGRIAYGHAGAVWVMRHDGTHKRRVLAEAYLPSWAPHGRRLLVNGEDRFGHPKFGILNLRAGTVRWYPSGELNGGAYGFDWSWRNNRIVFSGMADSDALADTYTVAPDFSTGFRQVTHTPNMHELAQRWAPAGANRLAYELTDFHISDERPCHTRLVVVRLANDTRTRIRCNANRPAWSPKATHLLAIRHIWNTPDDDLIKIKLDNGKLSVVVPHTSRFYSASGADWRPRH